MKFGLGEDLGGESVQPFARSQQSGHHGGGGRSQDGLLHRQHAHQVGDEQRQLGGQAGVGLGLDGAAPAALPVGNGHQRGHQCATQGHQHRLLKGLRDAAAQRGQRKAADAGGGAAGAAALAAFALQADQQPAAQGRGQAQGRGGPGGV